MIKHLRIMFFLNKINVEDVSLKCSNVLSSFALYQITSIPKITRLPSKYYFTLIKIYLKVIILH